MMPRAVVEPADAALNEDRAAEFPPVDFRPSVATDPVQRERNATGVIPDPRHHRRIRPSGCAVKPPLQREVANAKGKFVA